ncbi:MAG: tetratricopeptide repeat protein, partial [Methylocella sp.]
MDHFLMAENYRAARIEAQRYETAVKARFGADSLTYSLALDYLVQNYEVPDAEAEEYYKRALAIQERILGPDHPDVAVHGLFPLAQMYWRNSRDADAEPLLKRILAIEEKSVCPNQSFPDRCNGTDSLTYSDVHYHLAQKYESNFQYAEAEEEYKRALAIQERILGPDHPDVAAGLHALDEMYSFIGRYADEEPLLRRVQTIKEKSACRGQSNQDQCKCSVEQMHGLYLMLGRYTEAEQIDQRCGFTESLVGLYKFLGRYGDAERLMKQQLKKGGDFEKLASFYQEMGRYEEAEQILTRNLTRIEKNYGRDTIDVTSHIAALGGLYEKMGRYDEAEALYKREIAIEESIEKGSGDISNLAQLYVEIGRYAEAEPLLKLELDRMGDQASGESFALSGLSRLYHAMGRYAEAAEVIERLADLDKKAYGGRCCFAALGTEYFHLGRVAEGGALFNRALADEEKRQIPNDPSMAGIQEEFAGLYAMTGMTDKALAYSRKAASTLVAIAATDAAGIQANAEPRNVVEERADLFRHHLAILAAARQKGIEPASALGPEALDSAQRASQSSAALAVQQMSLRFAAGNKALAALVRECQDLAIYSRDREKALVDALTKPETQQNKTLIDNIRKQITETDGKLATASARLEWDFPDYAALANPKPLKVEETQKLLRPGEALVFILAGGKESYVFALTSENFDWQVIPLGKQALVDKVAAFRHGLDVDKLHQSIDAGKPELFDLNVAQEFYASLLGPIDALIKDKSHLLIVPTGPLTALPFHLLVTQKPAGPAPDASAFAPYRDAAFLVKRQAITVLPSVPSLKALRMSAREGQAPKILIGFGDPVFRAEENVAFDEGKQGGRIQVASRSARAYTDYWQGAELDRARLADVPPLPDTADELRAVAKALGAPLSDIHLGRDASETTVKRAPLADYRVVYFATHGLVAGDIKGLGEPA